MTENSYKLIRRRFTGIDAYSISFGQCELIQTATDEEATRSEQQRITLKTICVKKSLNPA